MKISRCFSLISIEIELLSKCGYLFVADSTHTNFSDRMDEKIAVLQLPNNFLEN